MNLAILPDDNGLILKAVTYEDIEILRRWKNENRQCFFYQDHISEKQQYSWFTDFSKRKDDFIFILKFIETNIGCIGFRLLDDVIDIYNVIIGDKNFLSKGFMSIALQTLCSFIKDCYPNEITVRVLRNNPAIAWYEKNYFKTCYVKEDHIGMKLDTERFRYIKYKILECE